MKITKLLLFVLTTFSSIQLVQAVSFQDSMNKKLFEEINKIGVNSDALAKIEVFLKYANPNTQQNGKTATMRLIERRLSSIASLLISPDIINALALLLKFNKDIDFIADNGMTALTFAASLNDVVIVKQLINAGADPLKEDAFGMTYQDYLDENKSLEYPERMKVREERRKEYQEKTLNEEFEEELEEFEKLPTKAELEEEIEEWEIINKD
jgi:ankyrin repeat protein